MVLADTDDNVPAPKSAAKFGRAKGVKNYTEAQDLMISKAFMNASEDATTGTAQRAERFKDKIALSYKAIVAEQLRIDENRYREADRVENTVQHTMGLSSLTTLSRVSSERESPYPDRNGDALHRRFTTTIHVTVSKFYALEKQNPKESGESKEQWYTRISVMYRHRHGHEFVSKMSLEYLRDKQKYQEFKATRVEAELKASSKVARPSGKTATVQKLREEGSIEKIAMANATVVLSKEAEDKEVMMNHFSEIVGMGKEYMGMRGISKASKKEMRAQKEAIMLTKLKTEQVKADLELMEAESKKRKLAQKSASAVASISVRSVVARTNGDDSDSSGIPVRPVRCVVATTNGDDGDDSDSSCSSRSVKSVNLLDSQVN